MTKHVLACGGEGFHWHEQVHSMKLGTSYGQVVSVRFGRSKSGEGAFLGYGRSATEAQWTATITSMKWAKSSWTQNCQPATLSVLAHAIVPSVQGTCCELSLCPARRSRFWSFGCYGFRLPQRSAMTMDDRVQPRYRGRST